MNEPADPVAEKPAPAAVDAAVDAAAGAAGAAGDPRADKGDAIDALLVVVLKENLELVDAAKRVFDYAKFLLDDDEKLTKTGALNGEARELLRKRITEVLP